MAIWLTCLAACGGGGNGGGDGGDSPGTGGLTLTVTPPADQTMLEGTPPATYEVTGRLEFQQDPGVFYIMVAGDQGVVAAASPHLRADNFFSLSVVYVSDLAPGDHRTTLTIHGCSDEQCTHELFTAVPVALTLHVLPNIQVQQQVILTRSGRDPAPSITLPVTVPVEAQSLTLSTDFSDLNAMAIGFDGTALHVDTRQVAAGTYTATATLTSIADRRYSRSVQIQYTVSPPPGGEHPMTLDPGLPVQLSLPQGSRTVRRVQVTRPTWTDAWRTPRLSGANPEMATWRDLGQDLYEVTIDTAGKPEGHYDLALTFDAGPTGGSVDASFTVAVEGVFNVTGGLSPLVWSGHSTLADLDSTVSLAMLDGSSRRWTASSSSPYVHFANTSGMTGVDDLRLSVDPALPTQAGVLRTLPLTVSVDLPGALPKSYELSLFNHIPRLRHAVTHSQVGGSSRLYVQGEYTLWEDPRWSDQFQVSGATLAQAYMAADTRFTGSQAVVALDLTGMVPGQDVTVRYNSALAPTQVQFQVLAPFTGPVAYQALPYGSYRPGQFLPGLASLYVAGQDKVLRWSSTAGQWALTQQAMPGVIDVAPSPDESVVYAASANMVSALEPLSLAVLATGDLAADPGATWRSFDLAAAPGYQALSFSADGRALGSVWDAGAPGRHGVAWVCPTSAAETGLATLTQGPATCDPGTGMVDQGKGFGMVRSPNGFTVEAVSEGGMHLRYEVSRRAWTPLPNLPAGVQVVAVSDDGTIWVRSDGQLMFGDLASGNLAAALPAGFDAAGYGLSAGGRYGVIYGYRRSGTGAAERATEAKVWIVDLTDAGSRGIAAAPVIDTVALPQALGCTQALVEGESCLHRASITLAPGQRTAFLVGPRGLAAVPLPPSAAETRVLRSPGQLARPAAAQAPIQRPLRRGAWQLGPSRPGARP